MSNYQPSQNVCDGKLSIKESGTSIEEKVELLFESMGKVTDALHYISEANESTRKLLELHVGEIAELKQQIEELKRTK